VIKDQMTGLTWTTNANLTSTAELWANALTYILGTVDAATKPGGYTDWRLPNINELASLVNYGQANPATWLGTQGFTNVQAPYYWSSTTYAPSTTYAWYIHMGDGYVDFNLKTSYGYYVWPVRGGQ
jgi:hypothetical protein